MKKVLSLLMALVLCLSLCACGSGSKESAVEVPASTEGAVEVSATIEYAVGEAFGTDSVECVITELKWLTSEEFKKYSLYNGDFLQLVPEYVFPDYTVNGAIGIAESKLSETSFLCITYSLQNIGKEVVDCEEKANSFGLLDLIPYGTIAAIYDDGYTFDAGGSGFFSTLSVLGDPIKEVMIIAVPNQVYENEDKPLKLNVTLPVSNGGTQDFVVDVDHIEKTDFQEQSYQEAVRLMGNSKYSDATKLLLELQGYKDADTLLLECCVKGWEGFDYLKEHKDEFGVITDAELIAELSSASWKNTSGEIWQFFEDGALDTGRTRPADGKKVIVNWSVQGDTLVLGTPIEQSITMRKVYDGAFVGFTSEGKVYVSIWKAE